jgi:hypothetical protein
MTTTFPSTTHHRFPSLSAKPEWGRVSPTKWELVTLEQQLYRWLRTQAFRAVNSGFDFAPRDEDFDDYAVEEVSLALHLFDLANAEVDLPAVIERTFAAPVEADWDDLLADGFVTSTTELVPALHRSGIRITTDTTSNRDESNGYFNHHDLVNKCLRVARFVIQAHDPEEAARLSAIGKKGGSVRLYTVDMLDALKPTVRSNPWRLARALGCSEATAKKLIKEDQARA